MPARVFEFLIPAQPCAPRTGSSTMALWTLNRGVQRSPGFQLEGDVDLWGGRWDTESCFIDVTRTGTLREEAEISSYYLLFRSLCGTDALSRSHGINLRWREYFSCLSEGIKTVFPKPLPYQCSFITLTHTQTLQYVRYPFFSKVLCALGSLFTTFIPNSFKYFTVEFTSRDIHLFWPLGLRPLRAF